ncbi:hypothetical protein [Sunxiuqinia elliptica]|uniref:Uncharacterized protein n=1 Tax=Sunxiuqinia elliptica TaxID=655355 RepID=A0A4R6GTX0_9BACT|nr:hypothetical protein [Sunxiuqinia elliptica]TDN98879.1 hypothetical protein DET52_1076 [Sunxiuqinia elliptica]TDO56320.1 hypothetical protein DET65_3870 [Sunxiuqinia elliptica]
MRSSIKSDRLSFKFGSLEWLNFYGLTVFLLILGFIGLFFIIKDFNQIDKITDFALFSTFCLLSGLLLILRQKKRLKFKRFNLNGELEEVKIKIRKLLTDNKWDINYDNKTFLQATYRGSLFNLDMLTLKFKDKEILWNIIHHPGSHNSIAATFSFNKHGKQIIKRIITYANEGNIEFGSQFEK